MLTKNKVLETIQQMPEEFSIDDLMERVIILEKVHTGLIQVKEGKTVSMEEARKRFQKWQK
ncbi:MAG: hypothetical protein H6577_14055 [Lewinellaceae bacterium]|nr:hypothetical protein [Saprospiraceae bacterium]MCB9339251.1 hypothetical protein [Lewinellaceae bacterium]